MGKKIFQLQNVNRLIQQNETMYEQEAHLQELLMNNPDLMYGAQIDKDKPRLWLLVEGEVAIAINDEIGY